MKYMKTSDIAKAAGIHPNTVRLYEEWGLLPPVPRSPAGYRLFTQEHLDQVRLVRLIFKCTMLGRDIKQNAYNVIYACAGARYKEALDAAENMEALIETECRQAERAEKFLEQWASNTSEASSLTDEEAVSTICAAKLLDITVDMLRDWERNSLIHIPRNPANGYRMYGPKEINKLRVIRVLRRSRYSNMAILRVMQKLDSGITAGLRETLDSPEFDEERGYLCFTDSLLTTLDTAKKAVTEIIQAIRGNQGDGSGNQGDGSGNQVGIRGTVLGIRWESKEPSP